MLTAAFQVLLNVELFLSIVLNASVHAHVRVALGFAGIVIVCVLAVAVLADVFAGLLLGVQGHFSVCINKGVHADNILGSAVSTRGARGTAGAKSELGQVHGVQVGLSFSIFVVASSLSILITDLKKRRASDVLDGVSSNPGHVVVLVVVVVVFKLTCFSHDPSSSLGFEGDAIVGAKGGSRDDESGNNSRLEQHG